MHWEGIGPSLRRLGITCRTLARRTEAMANIHARVLEGYFVCDPTGVPMALQNCGLPAVMSV